MKDEVIIILKDGTKKSIAKGTTVREIAEEIGPKLAKEAIAAKLNDVLVDLETPVEEDASLEILTFEDEEGKEVYRHSVAHVMAQAVQRLFPDVKLGIGPAIKDGFYYDFDSNYSFTPEDLEKIEREMEKIVEEDLKFKKKRLTKEEALELFNKRREDYKKELIEDLPEGEEISVYQQGEWIDLCAGPHVPSTKYIKAYKLLNLAGAYWRGSERNKMLQRIYGTGFSTKKDLKSYLVNLEEAKKRDHRKLGQQLGLFSLKEESPGFVFFHPKGMILRNILEDFWRKEHKAWGYQEIKTPLILSRELWEKSGHWDHYKENMYFTVIDEGDYAIKPMNCPGAMLVYKTNQHSYRDFPLRYAELGLVHRHERSGVLHGLMRARAFYQDDAHIFMLPSQASIEVENVINMVDRFYKIFGFNYKVDLSTRPEKAMGSKEIWDKAVENLKEAMEAKGIDYDISEGEGAFYGPKIDFHLEDSLGRTWQCGTIQLDFLMPEKFDLTYIGEDGQKHRPVTIHRVIYGSIERFIGILIEHYAGAFPVWLSPTQVVVLPIAERHVDYAYSVRNRLYEDNIRVEVDGRNEKIGYKIREAQLNKVPYMLIVGDEEEKKTAVSVRKRNEGDVGSFSLENFMEEIKKAAQVP